MQKNARLNIAVGAFVSLGLIALLVLALKVGNVQRVTSGDSYQLTAYFENVGGLRSKAPVSVSGVKIGYVKSIQYDPQRLQAKVILDIDAKHHYLSSDTQASIYTAGLLGEQYITLSPGAEETYLKDGDSIIHTQSAFVLEEIIGQVLVNMTGKE
ncbi:MAG TPA: outer membrane lipid asymmetry maintenance protein MlaD [Thiothrix sp.]|nr:outer membrane lipid asymmetry maintenance protein MlaD [Thiothrix sp.]